MKSVNLRWERFESFVRAWEAYRAIPCVYVVAGSSGQALRVDWAGEGLGAKYDGGQGFTVAAAMHRSGNLIFVARTAYRSCREVRNELRYAYRESLPFNDRSKATTPSQRLFLVHGGDAPTFCS